MTRRRSPAVATSAADISPGDAFTVRLAAAIRQDEQGWICRLATDSRGTAPTIWIPDRAEVSEVTRHQPAAVATGEVADPLTEVRK